MQSMYKLYIILTTLTVVLFTQQINAQLKWDYSNEETNLLSTINKYRNSKKIKALHKNDSLCYVASAHCADLSANDKKLCPLSWSIYGEWTSGDPCIVGDSMIKVKPKELVHYPKDGFEIALYYAGPSNEIFKKIISEEAYLMLLTSREMKEIGLTIYDGIVSIWLSR